MTWRLLAGSSDYLSWDYTYARRIFRERAYGMTEVSPTWQRCLSTATRGMGHVIAALYLHQHIGMDKREQASTCIGIAGFYRSTSISVLRSCVNSQPRYLNIRH